MSTHKNINRICVAVTILALVITIIFMNGKKLGLKSQYDEDSEVYEDSAYFTTNDLNGNWDDSEATIITLDGDTCKISGNGAYVNGNQVVISGGGKYVISGTWNDGNIVVDAYESSKVYIKLNGVDINCSDDACLRVNQADKVFFTLAEGTENILESGAEYSDEALEDGTGGTIFAHDDLTINGSGSLTITANYKHGIDANDDLIITGGTIAINAVTDGIHVNDSFRMKDADIVIEAGDDGIITSKEEAYVYIESGLLNITSSDDGIHATGDVLVEGGNVDISSGDDGIHSDTNVSINDGIINIPKCYEGIEALNIDIAGGETYIYPTDDGLNANGGSGDMFSFGGMQGGMNVNMGEAAPGFNPDNMFEQSDSESESDTGVSDGQTVEVLNDVKQSDSESESDTGAAEGQTVKVMNDVEQSDSGSESDTGAAEGQTVKVLNDVEQSKNESVNTGENADNTEEQETCINISGGKLTIINENGQDADGIDSNGSIYISGGEIYVSLSGNGTNNALDYASENGGICEITGGTIIACGGNGMVEAISDTSTQCSIMYNLSTAVDAGSTVTLKDADNKEIISYNVPCSFSSVVVSTPKMQQNETYTLTMGDIIEEITTESISGTYGEAVSTMGGMGGMKGGMRGGRRFDRNTQGTEGGATEINTQGTEDGATEINTQETADGTTDSNIQETEDGTSYTNTQETAGGATDSNTQDTTAVTDDGNRKEMVDKTTDMGSENMEDFTPPDMNGEQNFRPGAGMTEQNTSTEEDIEEDTITYSSKKEVTSKEWMWLGAASGVLILGLLVALIYKRW